jgi:hypothetical protein
MLGTVVRRHLPSAVALVVACLVVPAPAIASSEVGPAVDLGAVTLVKGDDPDTPVRSGNADTEFRVLLPAGSTCPGDSPNGQWRIQTFMVPNGVDVGTIKYAGAGPTGPAQFPLYTGDRAQRSWVNKILPLNTSPDPATTVPALPIFGFAAISVVKVPEGSYRIGVACTLFGATAQYWSTLVDITGSAVGNASTFRFTVPGAPAPVASDGPPLWVVLAVGAIGLIGGAVVVAALRRARSTSRTPHDLSRKEQR